MSRKASSCLKEGDCLDTHYGKRKRQAEDSISKNCPKKSQTRETQAEIQAETQASVSPTSLGTKQERVSATIYMQ